MKCTSCGSEIDMDADQKCPHCGVLLSAGTQNSTNGQPPLTGHTSQLAISKIGTSFVYPQAGNVITVDQMENAYLQYKKLRQKDYPSCKDSRVMVEVYCNRIFAFKYSKLYINMGGKRGGAISRLGILKIWKDRKQFYPWEDIISMDVKETTYYGGDRPETVYTVDMKLNDGGILGFNMADIVISEYSSKKIKASMFAYYYNRMRQERLQIVLERGGKRILLHAPLDSNYAKGIMDRFLSPEGLVLKTDIRKTAIVKPTGYINKKEARIKFRGKRKVTTEDYLHWEGITEIHLAKGLKEDIKTIVYWGTEKTLISNSGGSPQLPLETIEKPVRGQSSHIIALCWLAL